MSIANLHTSKPKLLVNYLFKKLLQVMTKNGELYRSTKFEPRIVIFSN